MTSKEDIKIHVLNRIKSTEIGKYPFYNLYIENIFPDVFYEQLKKRMLYYKYNSEELEGRNWDNPNFINKKMSLNNLEDDIIDIVKFIFDDSDIKQSFVEKFYINPDFIDEIVFKHDLQFVFTEKNRFQKIHTDIPAQFVSVVFYLPEEDISEWDELNNGTILYDKDLKPIKVSKFKGNSVSCFAAHFYSYHGFDTTINNRNTMLFFYAQKDLIKRFYDNSKNQNGEQNVDSLKNIIQWKISKYRLIEYGKDDMCFLTKLLTEKNNCKIDTLNGRIK